MREFQLLKHVFAANAALSDRVEVPPGDDMAVLRLNGTRLLAAVDQLVGGRHVLLDSTPIELVGRKAVTRSLSDIAAMAARPVASLAAVTLPPDFGSGRAKALFDAMQATAAEFDCPLIGGDVAFHSDASDPLVCSITVLAEPGSQPPVTRGGARSGDGVYVTGQLGGSYRSDGSGKHLTFQPRIREALALAEMLGNRLHAMIDISDGLGRDAGHIAVQSGVALELEAGRIPCNDGITWQEAASQGEDYELCFTASGEVPMRIGELPIARIGSVKQASSQPSVVILDGANRLEAGELGWQHEA